MEDRKATILTISLVTLLIIFIIIARVALKLSNTFHLIAGAGIAAILAVFAVYFIRKRFSHRRQLLETRLVTEGQELRTEYSFLRKVAGVPTNFRYKELEDATDGFQSLVGRGASASVFRGILSNGTAVAVKRMEGNERGEKDFKSEVAAIASVQHVNLVHLLGYCTVPTGPRFLVYEFIPRGSLDKWIFAQRGEGGSQGHNLGGCLSWDLRCRVILDVAKALSYLHHDCRSRILHLDVKPENILLDDNYRALVADFGLSKLMGKDESRIVTTIRGTRGYLAPEWLLEFGVSEKSDVYSFGMVILEIVGGRRNICRTENKDDKSKRTFQYFPKIVSQKLREGRLMEVVDQRVLVEERGNSNGIDEREVRRLVCVALWCIQEKARLRPSMKQVVEFLEHRVAVEEPPETHMIVVDFLNMDEEPVAGHHRARISEVASAQVNSNRFASNRYSFSSCMSMISGR